MIVIEKAKEMQRFADAQRQKGSRIAFVPTMGFLHRGHLRLMEEGKKHGDCLVTSIYVNPTQFGPKEDLAKYPRDFDMDYKLCQGVGVDVIYFPSNEEMYPRHYKTYVDLEGVTQNLCGLSRPGHFRGVATVCAKLFNLVKPHAAVFGKKDFQQLVVIKRMVEDLNMDLEIVGLDTVRESDGLAMSSRNTYLKPEEREKFDRALLVILADNAGTLLQSMFTPSKMDEVKAKLHGKTASDVIKDAERIRKAGQ